MQICRINKVFTYEDFYIFCRLNFFYSETWHDDLLVASLCNQRNYAKHLRLHRANLILTLTFTMQKPKLNLDLDFFI